MAAAQLPPNAWPAAQRLVMGLSGPQEGGRTDSYEVNKETVILSVIDLAIASILLIKLDDLETLTTTRRDSDGPGDGGSMPRAMRQTDSSIIIT
ncbi:hypothetical protein PoB_004802000 [Plakobranchus ocellatus]|uniref:Uncharacterized protein n=1 Tax=Plakobranchus ocellatus TaxID=259542 RepID=A0AAV4BPX3_9GAST|nr:hypothetical protein PoB_004802000 [Plakobranchus ocellatus]